MQQLHQRIGAVVQAVEIDLVIGDGTVARDDIEGGDLADQQAGNDDEQNPDRQGLRQEASHSEVVSGRNW